MKYLIFILFNVLTLLVSAQQLRIGVLREYDVKKILFTYDTGSYMIYGDSTEFGAILPNEYIEVSYLSSNKIELKKGVTKIGIFSKINLIATKINFSLSLTTKQPSSKLRKYQDDFEITAPKSALTIVNKVDMDNYLSGVVESEGGGGKDLEYYKVQALMSRTYYLKYKTKHEKDGFQLCDQVHCQAYHSMLRFTPKIREAVLSTQNIVMVDDQNELVDAYFHANCGGQTSEASYVWNNNIKYLNSFIDTFCIYTKQATWEKRIPQQKWADFLVKKYNYPIFDEIYGPLIFTFNQGERMAFYHSAALGVPLRDLRTEFGLKSTYFSCYPDGLDVVLRGKGYGHGVGLCQEGAMRMAKYNYDFKQIATYYFPGIHVIYSSQDNYFRQNPGFTL